MSDDFKRSIYVDFDGVIHSYTSGWKGAATIPDPPVCETGTGESAIEWLTILTEQEDFEVCIYSSRSKDEGGIQAMQEWLIFHGMRPDVLGKIQFPTEKGPAWVTIDDRALSFAGVFPHPGTLRSFVPWYKDQNLPSMPDHVECEGIRLTLDESGMATLEVRNYSVWVPLISIPKSEEYTVTYLPGDIRAARAKKVMNR